MTCSFSKDFKESGATLIDNAFISEYLPLAKGDAVRVYLYGLFLCQNPVFDHGLKDMAESLRLEEKEVLEYFGFWEQFGIVSVVNRDPLTVLYLPVAQKSATRPVKYGREKYSEFTKGLQAIIPTRMISTKTFTPFSSPPQQT